PPDMQPLDRNHAEFPRQNAEPSTRGRRIRVAHVTPTYFADESVIGGGERYVSNLARALAGAAGEFDFEQTIVALGRGDRSAVEGGIRVRVLPNDNPSPDPMAA